MKLKKYSYLLVFIMMLAVGTSKVYGLTCGELFGNGAGSLRELINDILQYPKYIVPVIIIVLGIVDLAKATFAAKEDEIKAAQKLLIKRAIYAVAIFFVVLIVTAVFNLVGSSSGENTTTWYSCWTQIK